MTLLRYLDEETIIDWTCRFVARPSEMSDDMEMAADVQAFVRECVRPILQEHAIECSSDGFGNLRVVLGPPDSEIDLAVFSYAMTHPQASMSEPFSAQLVDRPEGRAVRGRGVSEQKAAMAASLVALIDLAKSEDMHKRIAWFALTAGETGRHDAIAEALTTLRELPQNAILAVGSDGKISLGNRGRLDIDVTIKGLAAHSSTPWLGVSVVPAVAEVVKTIIAINDALPTHDILGPASLTCTSISTGPRATHTIPSDAHLVLDRRLLPHEDPEQVFAQLARSLSSSAEPSVSLSKGPQMYGAEVPADSPLLKVISEAMKKYSLQMPDCYYSQGALDAGYLMAKGISAVMWGPGETEQFHTAEESVLLKDLVEMTSMYRAVLGYIAAEDSST